MAIPHQFPSLIDNPMTQVVLIVGAGLSIPTVPPVEGLKPKINTIAISLAVDPSGDFYKVAERILKHLTDSGKTDARSRLWLAEELGLLDDRLWFGEVGLPISGNTPRHRAIARFAAEKRLGAIVSLNWDTLLETALDSIGLADGVSTPRPWGITAHCTVIDDADIKKILVNVFPIYKPHGCVRKLEQARRQFNSTGVTPPIVFKLLKDELENLPADQKTLVDINVHSHITQCPLIAVGWKASERYLRDTVINSAEAINRTETDAFTLVSRSWYPNDDSCETFHDDIAKAYDITELEAFACIAKPDEPTSDCMFQWLHARYSLNKLNAVASAAQKLELQQLLQQIDLPECNHPVLSWADHWLPTWVRLCWRAGAVHGNNPYTNERIEPWAIPIIPRDIHVPLGTMTGDRRELQAAAKLLAILGNDLSRFNFEKFPGGFWEEGIRKLYIPLPGWSEASKSADLAALKPTIEALRGFGFIESINLVWLDSETTQPNQVICNQLAAQVSRLMPLTNFAIAEDLTWVELVTLKGDAHDEMA